MTIRQSGSGSGASRGGGSDEPTPLRVVPERLRWSCPEEWLDFGTTSDVEAAEDENLGQKRAVDAVTLALGLRSRGYNVYVAGAPGSGRTRTVRKLLEEQAAAGPVGDDLCYVHNFDDPRSPRAIRLPAGHGRKLRNAMEHVRDRFRSGIAELRATSTHRAARQQVAQREQERQARLVREYQERVAEEGFALIEMSVGPFRKHDLAFVVGEEPRQMTELDQLVREEVVPQDHADHLRNRYPELAAELSKTMAETRALGRELESQLAELDRAAANPLIEDCLEEVRAKVCDDCESHEKLAKYIESVREFLKDIVPYSFSVADHVPGEPNAAQSDPLVLLSVNVLVDRSDEKGRPIVQELHPDPPNMLGVVEVQRGPDGGPRSDLTGIRAGALQKADGGFLLIDAHDLVSHEGSWTGLRNALRTGEVTPLTPQVEGVMPLHPKPTKLDVTVILIGAPSLRAQFGIEDPEFSNLFKVLALFEEHVPLTEEYVRNYVNFLAQVVQEEELTPLGSEAVGRLIERMVRLAGGRRKLSTNFRMMIDIAREASFLAQRAGEDVVSRERMHGAMLQRHKRSAFLSTRIAEAFADGLIEVEVDGSVIGQVNGLAVVQSGFGSVGYPTRITATTAVGHAGIIDIEREAELSGEIHTKASMILAGYLRSLFAQQHPLALTASICFEQSYGGVDGDSASCAELAALMSALASVPIRQDLAVTGAVDQHGQVLAVGGVNHKVEGFWRACCHARLTGKQGVVLPESTVSSLQLIPELLADIEGGRFHVYSVTEIGQVIELLLGTPLGVRGSDGSWPKGSLGSRIAARLADMAEILRDYGGADA